MNDAIAHEPSHAGHEAARLAAIARVAARKGFAGPFPQVRVCPTGGIDAERAPRYLTLPNVATVGGSWMVPGDALAARDWARIGALAREAAALRGR